MSLTVCCISGAPGPRVRALLEPFVGVADEVLVAADSRVGASDLAEYAAVADRLLRVDVVHSERLFAWLHAQCGGDWIFRIDADEVASPDLVAALPELMLNRDVREYWIPRVWLYPDARRWLDEPPWWPDYQLRLYRNGRPIYTGPVQQVLLRIKEAPADFMGAGVLRLGDALAPGEYLLQLTVTDPLANKKRSQVSQWMDFEVVEGSLHGG